MFDGIDFVDVEAIVDADVIERLFSARVTRDLRYAFVAVGFRAMERRTAGRRKDIVV